MAMYLLPVPKGLHNIFDIARGGFGHHCGCGAQHTAECGRCMFLAPSTLHGVYVTLNAHMVSAELWLFPGTCDPSHSHEYNDSTLHKGEEWPS
jgi:hypothetical protein